MTERDHAIYLDLLASGTEFVTADPTGHIVCAGMGRHTLEKLAELNPEWEVYPVMEYERRFRGQMSGMEN